MTPSTQANDTVKKALKMGIQEGEKLISTQVPNLGQVVNGWRIMNAGETELITLSVQRSQN